MHIIVALLLTLLITMPSHAIYKWRDPDGKLHFSDSPPLTTAAPEMIDGRQTQASAASDTHAKNDGAHSGALDRIAEIDAKAKQWREENREFSERECNAALKTEQTILELIMLEPHKKAHYSTDLNAVRVQKRIACPEG